MPGEVARSEFVNALLKCDTPSDVEFVDPWNAAVVGGTPWYRPNTLTFDEARSKGNSHFKNKEYDAALRMYDLALQLEPNHPIILFNRSTALLNMDRNYEAFESASLALDCSSTELNPRHGCLPPQRSGLRQCALFEIG
jgi:tetratricopeptide (TPR) repeat protein